MRANILSKIICDTYEQQFRRVEVQKNAMRIVFILDNHKKVELLLIWQGYVGVFEKQGGGNWHCLSCHDSCWRSDGVETFIYKYYDNINWINGLFNWYDQVEISPALDIEFRELERNRFK